jgi:hypothetical protein
MKNLLTNISQEEKNRILEMHSGMKKTIKEKYDDFNDDEQSRVNDLKQKHGVKFRDEFDDDDVFMDYIQNNRDSFDNFSREYKQTKKSTSTEPTDDETSELKQRHGVKFRDEFDDDDVFMDYIQNNRDSFDNLSKDLNDLRQTKRNR